MQILKNLFFDESGSPALEYALILGLVGVAIFVAMGTLADSTRSLIGVLTTRVGTMAGQIAPP